MIFPGCSLETFVMLTTISMVTIVVPGPDFLIVVRSSLFHSKRAGFWTVVGMLTGLMIHLTSISFAMGALTRTPHILKALQIVGGCYLLWLGGKGLYDLRTRKEFDVGTPTGRHLPPLRAFQVGLIGNLTNVPCVLFLISLFSGLLSPDMPLGAHLFLCGWRWLLAAFWFGCVVLFFAHPKVRSQFLKRARILEIAVGVLLCGFGSKLLISTLLSLG